MPQACALMRCVQGLWVPGIAFCNSRGWNLQLSGPAPGKGRTCKLIHLPGVCGGEWCVSQCLCPWLLGTLSARFPQEGGCAGREAPGQRRKLGHAGSHAPAQSTQWLVAAALGAQPPHEPLDSEHCGWKTSRSLRICCSALGPMEGGEDPIKVDIEFFSS